MHVCAYYEVRGGSIVFCQRDDDHEGEHVLTKNQKIGHPIPDVGRLFGKINPLPRPTEPPEFIPDVAEQTIVCSAVILFDDERYHCDLEQDHYGQHESNTKQIGMRISRNRGSHTIIGETMAEKAETTEPDIGRATRPTGAYRSEAMHHAVTIASNLSTNVSITPHGILELAKSIEDFLSGIDTLPSNPVVQETVASMASRLEKVLQENQSHRDQITSLRERLADSGNNDEVVDSLNTTILSYQSRNAFLEKRVEDLTAANGLLENSVQNHQQKNAALQDQVDRLLSEARNARPIAHEEDV